jgi:hypothetical protein
MPDTPIVIPAPFDKLRASYAKNELPSVIPTAARHEHPLVIPTAARNERSGGISVPVKTISMRSLAAVCGSNGQMTAARDDIVNWEPSRRRAHA